MRRYEYLSDEELQTMIDSTFDRYQGLKHMVTLKQQLDAKLRKMGEEKQLRLLATRFGMPPEPAEFYINSADDFYTLTLEEQVKVIQIRNGMTEKEAMAELGIKRL